MSVILIRRSYEYALLNTQTQPDVARANDVTFEGNDRALATYHPQFDLPPHLPRRLSPDASTAAQLSTRQTGGYLLLLEQVLSNHYAQLDKFIRSWVAATASLASYCKL